MRHCHQLSTIFNLVPLHPIVRGQKILSHANCTKKNHRPARIQFPLCHVIGASEENEVDRIIDDRRTANLIFYDERPFAYFKAVTHHKKGRKGKMRKQSEVQGWSS